MEQKLNCNFKLPDSLIIILEAIIKKNAVPVLVGGIVRDGFLNKESKDYDIEVYNLNSLSQLEEILKEFGTVNLVGKSFGILKLNIDNIEIDFSFPRVENKTSLGHTGFDVIIDGKLDFKEASKRRDFTINAIGYDFKNKIFIDPFDGINDINNKTLKHIDDKTFIEDPLRVYRAVQFCARFDLELDINTKSLCKKIVSSDEFNTLSKERIFEEYKKLLLKSHKPSIGLKLIEEFKIECFDKSIFENIDLMTQLKTNNTKKNLVLMFYFIDDILKKISDDKKLIKDIEKLKNFKIPKIYKEKIKDITSDAEVVKIKFEIMNDMPKPFIMGKDLIKLGLEPSVKFKKILDNLYQMQLDGLVSSKEQSVKYILKKEGDY